MCQQQRLVLLQVPEWLYLERGQENMFPETGESGGGGGGPLQMRGPFGFPEADTGCHPATHSKIS